MKRARAKQVPESKQSRRTRTLIRDNKVAEKPTITKAVRHIVAALPDLNTKEVSQELIRAGWDPGEIERRAVTIATLRADASAVLQIAQEEGWSIPVDRTRNK